jgi:hypothetical protein
VSRRRARPSRHGNGAAPLRGRALLYLRPGSYAPVWLLFPERRGYAGPDRPSRRARIALPWMRGSRAETDATQMETSTRAASGVGKAPSGVGKAPSGGRARLGDNVEVVGLGGADAVSQAEVPAVRRPEKPEARS